ncbi:hypothetical protein CB1_002337017 [Camelus ferus]|nr:hypothetical protein CB1_002337017 [Camelus ferus]
MRYLKDGEEVAQALPRRGRGFPSRCSTAACPLAGAQPAYPGTQSLIAASRWKFLGSEDEDDDLQYADHDYEVPQQKGLKKLWNRVKWTRDEDDKLKKLVEQHGTDDWTLIASHLQNRSDFQCQHRWQKVLNPELIKGPWTKEEDQRIPGYQYLSPEGNCVEHVQTSSAFIQQPGSFSSWSGSFLMDDSVSNTLNSLEEHAAEFYRMDDTQAVSAQQSSPTKFLAVEANAVLSSLQTIPEFAETLELIESDPVAWSDVTSFDLSDAAASPVKSTPVKLMRIQHNEGAMECQVNVSLVLEGKKTSCNGADGEAVPLTSPNVAKFSTPPTILRKKRRMRVGQSPGSELGDGSFSDGGNTALKHTPVKTLPFSPSQVEMLFLIMFPDVEELD